MSRVVHRDSGCRVGDNAIPAESGALERISDRKPSGAIARLRARCVQHGRACGGSRQPHRDIAAAGEPAATNPGYRHKIAMLGTWESAWSLFLTPWLNVDQVIAPGPSRSRTVLPASSTIPDAARPAPAALGSARVPSPPVPVRPCSLLRICSQFVQREAQGACAPSPRPKRARTPSATAARPSGRGRTPSAPERGPRAKRHGTGYPGCEVCHWVGVTGSLCPGGQLIATAIAGADQGKGGDGGQAGGRHRAVDQRVVTRVCVVASSAGGAHPRDHLGRHADVPQPVLVRLPGRPVTTNRAR